MMKTLKNLFKDKKFLKSFFVIAFPVMLQTLVSFIVNFVDNLMVGGVSNAAVSAVYAANQATFLFIIAAYGVTAGAGIFIQQFFAAKDEEHIKQAFRYKLIMTIGLLIVLIPIYYIWGEKLIWFYCKADKEAQEVLRLGKEYLNIIILSYVPYAVSVVYSNTLREMGKTKIPLYTGVVALVCNIVFNALFIYGLELGVAGAAYATIIARVVELIVIIAISHGRKEAFCRRFYINFKIEKKLAKDITSKTIPLFINEMLWALGMIFLSLAYAQRDSVLSALSVVSTVSEIFGIIFQGLSVGTGVMVGGLLGANKMVEAKDNAKKLFLLGTLISLAAGVLMAVASPFIPMMFNKVDAGQKEVATQLILVYASLLWAYSLCVSSYQTLRAGGNAKLTLFLEFTCMWLVAVPVGWVLASYTGVGIIVIYICVQACDIIKAALGLYLVSRGTWINNLTIKKEENLPVLE